MSHEQMEILRQQGLERIRQNEPEEALPFFDQALAACRDDETAELVRINKSFALIALERFDAPEVRELPRIVLRRSNLRHVYLAAYRLSYRFRLENNLDRARHYGRICSEVASQLGEAEWLLDALTELGNIAVYDSRFEDAIEAYGGAMALLPGEGSEFRRFFLLHNLGYSRLVSGDAREGVDLIHQAIEIMHRLGNSGYLAESYIDLCHGYLELGDLDQARHYGEMGLERLVEARQERNVHYLLGEIAYKSDDFSAAEHHFDHLATHYPDFPQLKNLLLAVDLRTMINWKLS
jgi:tetratricopeptide (TPR) repeat protein